jgi:hypothetical protein
MDLVLNYASPDQGVRAIAADAPDSIVPPRPNYRLNQRPPNRILTLAHEIADLTGIVMIRS